MVFVLALAVLWIVVEGPYWRVAPGVTPAAIRAIRVGMSHDAVTAILGQPLQTRAWAPAEMLLLYARPHALAPWSSRLWIYLRGGRVDTIQGERIPLIADKRGVYLLQAERPPWATDEFEATFEPWWRWVQRKS